MIEVRNLHKSFGDLTVLEDVSLTVEDGETLAIIGHSGSGKSVLMKHLVGLLKPDRGQILVDDVDINAISYDELRKIRRKFGVLFQGGALFDSMSSFENVAFPIRNFTDKSAEQVDAEVERCLSSVNLDNIGDKRPSELSGGMRKRVALARAIALEPRYVLYDEPTSGLDPETSDTINELICDFADAMNMTSVVVTHDMHSVLTIADRVAFLYDSGLRWFGPVEDIHKGEDPVLNNFVKASEYHIGPPPSQTSESAVTEASS